MEFNKTPPTNGPNILVPGIVSTLVAKALLKCDLGTVLAINACLTGNVIAYLVPAKNA